VGLYQRLSTGLPVKWLDVSQENVPLPAGLSVSNALARFHVLVTQSGSKPTLLSGAQAFSALWKEIPGWKLMGTISALPMVNSVLEVAYVSFLKIRPRIQKWVIAMEPAVSQSPPFMVADLRSDHAGETGAVWIYKGILLLTRNPEVRRFATHHLETEQKHLALMESILPWRQRSRLLPFWRIAGFMTGAIPAVFGANAVFGTIAAVETFVDQHYEEQIIKLANAGYPGLLNTLKTCQQDECDHRDEALSLSTGPSNFLLRIWCAVVGVGSSQAVKLARLI
jgi:3-demethoxyubiquinol 3-hydroxylase